LDLNYLYHRQQVSLFRSVNGACTRSRLAHRQLATAYETLIDQFKGRGRRTSGLKPQPSNIQRKGLKL
jgi:hypothetical protein